MIAEGVETEAQRHFLKEEGCDELQGFLFSPALDPFSFEQRLRVAGRQGPPPARGVALTHRRPWTGGGHTPKRVYCLTPMAGAEIVCKVDATSVARAPP